MYIFKIDALLEGTYSLTAIPKFQIEFFVIVTERWPPNWIRLKYVPLAKIEPATPRAVLHASTHYPTPTTEYNRLNSNT